MAVRDDFAAGEVLAAADLNDTFASKADYPSGGSDGDMLTKSGTTTAWAAPSSGLVHVHTETITAQSSVSMNDIFSADYDNYTMTFVGSFSANTTLSMRLRASGSDASGSNYYSQYVRGVTTTASANNSTTNILWMNLVSTASNVWNSTTFFSPFLAANTRMLSLIGQDITASGALSFEHQLATSYDGLSIFVTSGTFSGTFRLYGLQNS